MKAIRLQTEYLTEPLGLGIADPRFSWNCDGGVQQSAYQIIARREGRVVWDSGIVSSSRMVHVPYEGDALESRDRVDWELTVWDENGHEGTTSSSWFELGLLGPHEWTAQWVTGAYEPEVNTRYPVDYFRRTFAVDRPVDRARLYITSCGVYEAKLNGRPVGEFSLAPGSTDYRKRLQYQAYDVTALVKDENTLHIELADGWYRGSIGAFGPTNVFGRETKLLFQLEVHHTDGTVTSVVSDDGLEWSNDGALRFADLKDGELYDARLEPSYSSRARIASPGPTPTASDNVAPRMQESFVPTLLVTKSGAQVLDFGQNIAGFIAFEVDATAGQTVRLRMGEILDGNGEFTQANMQLQKPADEFGSEAEMLLVSGQGALIDAPMQPTPLQQVEVRCADGRNAYRTSFAVFGFRYALIETDVSFDPADFRAIAVYSDMEQTGEFECSNEDVNQLLENTRWSMKGNFLDVPTDCPTRERLGWTGDAQIFFDTAAYLMDVASFFRKWLRDVQDAQEPSGRVSAVVPFNGISMMYDATGESVGWCDALVLLPYRFWKRYGDDRLLQEFYPMMRAYGMFMIANTGHEDPTAAASNPHDRYVYEKGFHLGEWLEPEEFRDAVFGPDKPSRAEEATAYLHYTMRHLREIAAAVGERKDSELFAEYAEGAQRAYEHLFVIDGTIDTDRQAKLVRPLGLGLITAKNRHSVERRLVEAVENRDYRIGTGFLSTPFVLPVLTDAGRVDVAYRMLENTKSPSWLAEVQAGATTVWEDWEGKDSQNHYSPGAVCQWLFDTVAGVRVAGENRFTIEPTPGGTLTHAHASYLSPYGVVSARWRKRGGNLYVTVRVPSNTSAVVRLPSGVEHEVRAGETSFVDVAGV